MIRLRSRRTRRTLDPVQPVHVAGGISAAREVSYVLHIARESCVQEVRVERDNDVGFRKVVPSFDSLTEGHLGTFENAIAIDRLVDMPLRLWIKLLEASKLIGECGRSDGRGENPDARPLQRLLRIKRPADRAQKR